MNTSALFLKKANAVTSVPSVNILEDRLLTDQMIEEVYDWLQENCGSWGSAWDYVRQDYTEGLSYLAFKDPKHAVLFKLRWG